MTVISQKDYLDALTDDVLRDLARNESCSPYMRKESVRLLMTRKSAHVRHEDFRKFVDELKSEAEAHQEVVAIVESATEAPFEPIQPPVEAANPALTASFTTSSL